MAEDSKITSGALERLDVPALGEASARLVETLDDLGRLLADVCPDRVALLLPEHSPQHKKTHAEIAPRVALETLVRLAGVRADVPVEVLARRTVRSRLNLPSKGTLSEHVGRCVHEPVGRYWNDKRDVAALAALAGGHG